MAKIAIDVEIIREMLRDVLHCIMDCNQISFEADVLDCLIEDQFDDAERNQIGREFVVKAYQSRLTDKATSLEAQLESIRDCIAQIAKTEAQAEAIGNVHHTKGFSQTEVSEVPEVKPLLSSVFQGDAA